MKITDKLIEDMIYAYQASKKDCSKELLKEKLKEKGYEVEEPKSKLEEARDYLLCERRADQYLPYIIVFEKGQVEEKIKLYEEAIEEERQTIIDKMKNCGNCKYANQGKCYILHCNNYNLWEME
jgi:hypothetical protein